MLTGNKYSREELRARAQEWFVDHTAGGEKSFQVVMRICIMTGLAADAVVDYIKALAEPEVDCHV